MNRRRALKLFSGLGALPLLNQRALAQSEGPLVLGQSAAFSGPAAQLGQQYHLGAQVYFEALNARGGVNGRQVVLKKLDDGYEPERCAANTRQFIADDVFALFGYVGTSTAAAALPLVTEARVPLFAPLTGATSLREPYNRQVVHVRASYDDETAAIVRHASSSGIRKIAVFHQNDGYGQAGLAGVMRAMSANKEEPVAIGTVERNSTDVASALAAILPKSPEAIVQIGTYKACASFVRLARRAGFSGTFYNVSFVGTQALLDELGAMAAGVAVSQVVPFPYSPATALSSEYLTALRAESNRGIQPNYSGMEGYLAARVFAEAATRAGKKLTRESFLSAVQGMSSLNLGGFTLNYGPNKNTGSTFVELTLLTKDGTVRR